MSLRRLTRVLRGHFAWLVLVKLVLAIFVLAYASITVTPITYHAENGGAIAVTGNLTATDRGITRATSNVTSAGSTCTSSSNVTLAAINPAIANSNLTVNDYVYTIRVNATESTQANHCFTVTLTINTVGQGPSTYTVYIATGSSPGSNQAADCIFDIGSTLPPSPYSFSVVVA